MAAVAVTLLGAWLLMLLAPDTRHARLLHRALIERPAALLNRVTAGQVLMLVALLVIVGTAMWFEAGDLLGFLSLAAPEMVSWAVTFEIGTLVEAGTALLAIAASRRSVGLRMMVGAHVRRLVAGRRAARRRRSPGRAARAPANDDADGGRHGWQLAG